jgi:type VI secretion system protein ImpE
MLAEDLLRAGQPEEALAALTAQVRNKPADADLRVFLFQLLAVLGRWDRARTQLDVVADLKPDAMMMINTCRMLLLCERHREAVFAGQQDPVVFGEPAEWQALLVQALRRSAAGELSAAADLRHQALEAAPAIPGSIDDQPFAWIADTDSRLGPMLEAMVDGRYFWIPFQRIREIRIDPPGQLRDLVWTPAYLAWENGGRTVGMLPVRYPGTTALEDGPLKLARKTRWEEDEHEIRGLGQRVLATDQDDYALLDIRRIELQLDDEPVPEVGHG